MHHAYIFYSANLNQSRFYLRLIEVADQSRFDLHLKHMLFVIRCCFVVLQTWPKIKIKKKQSQWSAIKMNGVFYVNRWLKEHRSKSLTEWRRRGAHEAGWESCCRCPGPPAGGAVSSVWSPALVYSPHCWGSNSENHHAETQQWLLIPTVVFINLHDL